MRSIGNRKSFAICHALQLLDDWENVTQEGAYFAERQETEDPALFAVEAIEGGRPIANDRAM